MLAGSIGQAAGLERVEQACRDLQLSDAEVTQQQALAIFEHLAKEPGLVGIAARFAKSRVILAW